MRMNMVIDDKLMRDALRATGLKTKREAVELGLRTLLRLKKQGAIRRLRGKLAWQGDLDAIRDCGWFSLALPRDVCVGQPDKMAKLTLTGGN